MSLLGNEPGEFEMSCQKASDSVGDLSQIVLRERTDKEADAKVDKGRAILLKSSAMFREIETDAEIMGLAENYLYANAHSIA